MKRIGHTFYWGIVLLVGGAVLLLANMGEFDQWKFYITLAVIAIGLIGGLFFLAAYFRDRTQWWLWTPATTLLTLAAVVYLGSENMLSMAWLLAILALGVGLGFLIAYVLDQTNWWALIPWGILWTIGILTGVSPKISSGELPGFFFIALGIVAVFLYFVRRGNKEGWPAALLAVLFITLGFLLLSLEGWERGKITKFWPLAFVILGALITLWRVALALQPEAKEPLVTWEPPEQPPAPTTTEAQPSAPPAPQAVEQPPQPSPTEGAPPQPTESAQGEERDKETE
jgi:hypothetical protein